MIISFFAILYGCSSKHEARVFLIPKGYEGPLLLIEDESSNPVEQRGDTLVFDFTKSIVVRHKGKFIENSSSLSNLKYFYVDEFGNRTEIPYALGSYTKTDSNSVYVQLKHTQVSENAQCDLISSPRNFAYYFQQQAALCDSLLSKRP